MSAPTELRLPPAAQHLRLTPLEQRLLATLWESTLDLSYRELVARVYAGRKRPDKPIGVIKVMVCHLRQKLAGTPLRIETTWGNGYRLVTLEAAAAD